MCVIIGLCMCWCVIQCFHCETEHRYRAKRGREGGNVEIVRAHLVQIVYTTGVFNWCAYFTP